MKIILIFLYLALTFFEAFKDAHFYYYQSMIFKKGFPPHFLFTIHRFIFGGLVWWISKDWLFCLGLIFMFPLLFDGVYYEVRNRLDSNTYQQGWASESNTSKSLIEIPFFFRLSLAMAGLVMVVATLFDY